MNKSSQPNIKASDWVVVGKNGELRAVACSDVNKETDILEVVYLDQKKQAINEDVKWTGSCWEFVIQGPCGGYADKYSRLSQYVQKLTKEC